MATLKTDVLVCVRVHARVYPSKSAVLNRWPAEPQTVCEKFIVSFYFLSLLCFRRRQRIFLHVTLPCNLLASYSSSLSVSPNSSCILISAVSTNLCVRPCLYSVSRYGLTVALYISLFVFCIDVFISPHCIVKMSCQLFCYFYLIYTFSSITLFLSRSSK